MSGELEVITSKIGRSEKKNNHEKLYTNEELAEFFKVSLSTIKRERLEGKLDFVMHHGGIRVPESSVKKYVTEKYHNPNPSVYRIGDERELPLLAKGSVAELLSISYRTLRREYEEGKLAYVKVREQIRFRVQDILSYVIKNYVNPDQNVFGISIGLCQNFLSPQSLAEFLGLWPINLKRLYGEGRIAYVNVRGQVRFIPSDVMTLLKRNYVNPDPKVFTFDWNLKEKLLTIKSLAQFLGVSQKTVTKEYRERKIPYIRLSGKKRFRMSDVKNYLAQNYYLIDIHESDIKLEGIELPLKKPTETAVDLGIPATTLRLRREEGQIRYLKIRGQIRYRPADVSDYKNSQSLRY